MLPLTVTSRTFGDDWTLHLWLIRQQELNIQANGRPGLFLSARPLGAFYPVFAFVGSGIYTVGGYLAMMLGDQPILAYKLLYLGALCLGYGGMTWLASQAGLQGWRSQMPGLVLVTGAYFVTDMFGRGDLGELTAISAIPFLIAAATAVMTSHRLKPAHLLGVVVGLFCFTGSHNITLLYGTIFLALLALVLLVAYAPVQLSRPTLRRLPALIAAAAIGIGLNAWYLLADVAYSSGTEVASWNQDTLPRQGPSRWSLLLDPLRPADSSKVGWHEIRVSLPWLFAAWATVAAVVMWRRIDSAGRRLIMLIAGITGLYFLLLRSAKPWRSFPHLLYNIQFLWRLHAYVLLATALFVMVVLVSLARANEATRRATSAALVVIAVFSVGAATAQAWIVPSTYYKHGQPIAAPGNFSDVVVAARSLVPPSWYEPGDFRYVKSRVVELGFARKLIVPEADVRGSTFTGRLDVPPGPAPFRTNIASGSQFTSITGIEPIGITASGYVVAVRDPRSPERGPVDITIRQAHSTLLRAGALLSMLSLAALAWLLAWQLLALRRPRYY